MLLALMHGTKSDDGASATPTATALQSAPAGEACSVCDKRFTPRLAFHRDDDRGRWYCSLPCRAQDAVVPGCEVCGGPVRAHFAWQMQVHEGRRVQLCSEACRDTLHEGARKGARKQERRAAHRMAVLNQKGGTGKTTTAISLAAGLAEAGKRVLLVDSDPQGNVGVSLGVSSRRTLYHVLMEDVSVADAAVPLGRDFDVLSSDGTLAHAELSLAREPGRAGVFKERLGQLDYDHIVIDCGPALSMLNQHALCFADEVLVPVACEYLSLIGVKQLLATVRRVNMNLGHPLVIAGVLPTFYDQRTRGCHEALEALKEHFGELCLQPIRANVRLKEAPRHKKSIFEYDASSSGAEDYRALVRWALARIDQPRPTTVPEPIFLPLEG